MIKDAEDTSLEQVDEPKIEKKKRPGFFDEITEVPAVFNQSYFPSLDGFRAVSIMLVIIFHIFIAFGHSFPVFRSGYNFNFADLGVQIFFVISGFLITTLLLKEKVNKGTISLKRFYIRRFFRIIPVAYLYLTVVVILGFVFKLHLNPYLVLASFLFLRNFSKAVTGVHNLTTHYWSLAVEEQFYLLFPLVMKKSLRTYLWFLFGILSFSFMIDAAGRDTISRVSQNIFVENTILVITQFHGIAIGSLFSILIFKNIVSFGQKYRLLKISGLLTLVVLLTLYSGSYSNTGNMLKCVSIAMLLVINLTIADNAFFRLLNSKAMKLIGVLSFSIYIWQQPLTLGLNVINQSSLIKKLGNPLLINISIMIFLLAILGIASYLSYNFYEKKFLKLKERFK